MFALTTDFGRVRFSFLRIKRNGWIVPLQHTFSEPRECMDLPNFIYSLFFDMKVAGESRCDATLKALTCSSRGIEPA